MQRLTIVLIILCLACSSDDEQTYSDITGKWKFQTELLTGQFEIVKSTDGKFFLKSGSTFTISGKPYTSVTEGQLSINGFSVQPEILLADNTFNNFINLSQLSFSEGFKSMTSKQQGYNDCSTCANKVQDQTVEIARQ
jgi:hypothetical protein